MQRRGKKLIQLIANGDLRLSANQKCWAAQDAMEKALSAAIEEEGFAVARAHPFMRTEGHGFIGSQKEGMDVFRSVDPQAPLIVAARLGRATSMRVGVDKKTNTSSSDRAQRRNYTTSGSVD